MYLGRIIGALVGLLLLRNPIGFLLAFAAGWYFDKSAQNTLAQNNSETHEKIQTLFMQLLFTSMGRLAKVDGRVSTSEIQQAEKIIQQLGLDENGRQQAIQWFQQGVKQTGDVYALLQEFLTLSKYKKKLHVSLLENLLQIALADGVLDKQEEQFLFDFATRLGFPASVFQRLLEQLKAQYGFYQHSSQQQQHQSVDKLAQAYRVLAVKPEDSDAAIKKAYRKQMSEHHPDKLMAQGLPDAAIKQATVRSQAIQEAYEYIRKARGITR